MNNDVTTDAEQVDVTFSMDVGAHERLNEATSISQVWDNRGRK